jgi:mannose-1-phosphate guanylyltransferase / mannose-6-phosphate isomerase
MNVIILAGGSGTRLWPLSRKYYPKQFAELPGFGGRSLFELTLERARRFAPPEKIFVVTSEAYYFHVVNQSERLGVRLPAGNIFAEPVAKNTLVAVAAGLSLADSDDEPCLVLSSDHVFRREEGFVQVVLAAQSAAADRIVTFGVAPEYPETGYGYIEPAETGAAIVAVKKFHEKPDHDTAVRYIEQGYLWNAGIFLLSRATFRREMEAHDPEFVRAFFTDDSLAERYERVPGVSIDYGLLEKSRAVSVAATGDIGWSDLGSFDAIAGYLGEEGGNEVISHGSSGNFAVSDKPGKTVALVGVEDLVVVDTRDALLVARRGATQDVKKIVDELDARGREESKFGLTVYRPWGSYTIIDEGKGFKTKRLSVLPGKKLSSQMHHHRSEHWVVVSGTARVEVDDRSILLRKGESTFIPLGSRHRLENPGKIELHIIESQIGDYLGEDDIVRFDDDFGRK